MIQHKKISIHALLAESDNRYGRPIDVQLVFLSTLSLRRATAPPAGRCIPHLISIHALLAESDNKRSKAQMRNFLFLSTLSLRRATISCARSASKLGDFYPRSPCGERRALRQLQSALRYFYPRSPCGERLVDTIKFAGTMLFLSTLSLRRATSPASVTPAPSRNFYPRSPCGERPTGVLFFWTG